jgi:hypothetical protein
MIRQREGFVSRDYDQAALRFVSNMINPYLIFVLILVSPSYSLNMVQIYNGPQIFYGNSLNKLISTFYI